MPSTKVRIFSQARAHFGHHVLAVDQHRALAAIAQRRVQHRPILGGVDFLATEHGVDATAQTTRVGERDQQTQRLGVDALPGEIEQQVELGGPRERHRALRVVREQIPQMPASHARRVRIERLPLRRRVRWRHGKTSCCSSSARELVPEATSPTAQGEAFDARGVGAYLP